MKIRAGFIPLVDCAVLVAAERCGFAAREGIELELVREASWATVRDKLTAGHMQCAHLLAPMVVASQLQIGNPKTRLVAPFALSMNGNAISVSTTLYAAIEDQLGTNNADTLQKAQALSSIVRMRKSAGQPPLTFGMVYPFSSHNYQLRYWLASGEIHPDRDVTLVVIPPPFVVDYLREGHIDGFCVGAPWNTIGAIEGVSRPLVSASDIWNMAPEKVLGAREDWALQEPEALAALMRALMSAARFCDDPANRAELAAILAAPEILDLETGLIERVLAGQADVGAGTMDPRTDYFVFHRSAATFPWRSHALWFYSQMVRWGQVDFSPDQANLAGRAYRPDIFRSVFKDSDVALPAANSKVEGALHNKGPVGSTTGQLILEQDGFFDGQIFDPESLADYIGLFKIRSERIGGPFQE